MILYNIILTLFIFFNIIYLKIALDLEILSIKYFFNIFPEQRLKKEKENYIVILRNNAPPRR